MRLEDKARSDVSDTDGRHGWSLSTGGGHHGFWDGSGCAPTSNVTLTGWISRDAFVIFSRPARKWAAALLHAPVFRVQRLGELFLRAEEERLQLRAPVALSSCGYEECADAQFHVLSQ